MALRVFACVSESVFLRGLESVFPEGDLVYCGGAVDEATLFDRLPQAGADVLVYELTAERHLPYLSILRRNFPRLPVIVLLEPECEYLAISAMEKGAIHCLAKTVTRETLLNCLHDLDLEAGNSRTAACREAELFELAATARHGGRRFDNLATAGLERKDLGALIRELSERQAR